MENFLKPEVIKVLISIIENAVKIAELTKLSGQDKKTIATKIAIDAYKAADLIFLFPDLADTIVLALIPTLIDVTIALFNANGQFKK